MKETRIAYRQTNTGGMPRKKDARRRSAKSASESRSRRCVRLFRGRLWTKSEIAITKWTKLRPN